MEPFCIVTDTKRCISCQACVAHCKIKNAVPEGVFLSHVTTTGPHLENGKCVMHSEFQTCYSCEKAWCLEVCSVNAIHRDADGTVWIDAEQCIGCGLCAKACPWHMPHMIKMETSVNTAHANDVVSAQARKAKRIAIKCDHCRDLRSQGMQPACVTACTSHALQYLPLSQTPHEFQELYAQRMSEVRAKADAFVEKVVAKR